MKFRKKPVIIDAIQYKGKDNQKEFLDWALEFPVPFEIIGPNILVIHTLEGAMRANYGDWIIRGVAGEYYPCKPNIFEQTYEVVN